MNIEQSKKLIGVLSVLLALSCAFSATLWIHGDYTSKVRKRLTCQSNKCEAIAPKVVFQKGQLMEQSFESKKEGAEKNAAYLCVGNSLTLHGKCDYWWGEWGMAASAAENDYFHQLGSLLAQDANVIGRGVNFSVWELNDHDRSEALQLLDPYLARGLDLIVLQVGENVTVFPTFEQDYVELIEYVRAHCPEAKVVVMGQYRFNPGRQEAKINASAKTGVPFISLDDSQGGDFDGVIGTMVQGEDGQTHKIEHPGVAMHPGDKGMRTMAEKIYQEYSK